MKDLKVAKKSLKNAAEFCLDTVFGDETVFAG
jgi:hypothetical protein